MAPQRWWQFFVVMLLVLGGSGWVFNPSGEPGRGIVWNQFQTQQTQEREAAIARHNYCPTGGCVIRLEDVTLHPVEASPGATLTLTTKYTILTPENLPIPVTISREVMFQGKSLGRVKAMDANVSNGTYDQDINFTLPADATPGVYTVVTRVSTGYGFDHKDLEFYVK